MTTEFIGTLMHFKTHRTVSVRMNLDSAFSNSPFVVSSFKKQAGKEIPDKHDRFNKLLSKVWMRLEHTIGIC